MSNTKFCPNCRTEYREGFDICADCGSELVAQLPPLPEPEQVEYEEVIRTFNLADIAVIESVLSDQEIEYYVQGENFNLLNPLVQPARVMIRKEQADTARELLKDLDIRYTALSPPQDGSGTP